MAVGRGMAGATGVVVPLMALAACGSADAPPTSSATASATAAGTAGAAGPTLPVTAVNRTTPPGPLTPAQLRLLIIYFNDQVSAAYAAGDTTHLSEFLAGPELTGISATITQLNKRNQRNIFRVAFDSLTVISAGKYQMIFHLFEHTTDNHFVDVTTQQVLNQGYPGPQAEAFTMYFSYNPQVSTWYWTGAKTEGPQ